MQILEVLRALVESLSAPSGVGACLWACLSRMGESGRLIGRSDHNQLPLALSELEREGTR